MKLTKGVWRKKCHLVSPTKLCPTLVVDTTRSFTQLVCHTLNMVNKWGVFTVVSVNQYCSLFSLGYCATRLLQMNLCDCRYYLQRQLFGPKLMDRQRCTLWTETEKDLLRLHYKTHITILMLCTKTSSLNLLAKKVAHKMLVKSSSSLMLSHNLCTIRAACARAWQCLIRRKKN